MDALDNDRHGEYHKLAGQEDGSTMKYSIVYSVVAHGQIVLAEYSSSTGNFPTITRVVLSKIRPNQTWKRDAKSEDDKVKKSYKYDSYVFHLLIERDLVFLCLAGEAVSRRIAYLYLEDVYEEFRKRHVSQDSVATFASVPLSLNNEFKPVLKQQTVFYNEESSKREAGNQNASVLLQRVRNEVDDVKNIVVENIEKILQRGEKIELLVDKTDRMQQTALKFETSAKHLKRSMWWKNVKKWAMMGSILAVVLFFIVASACGGINFHSCRSQ